MTIPISDTEHPGKRTALAGITYFSQFLYGGWFLFHGLNYWFAFYHDRSIEPGPGLVPAIAESGLMAVAKALEIAIGLALLLDLFAALAIAAAWPITLMIAFVTASHGKPFGIGVTIVIIALNAMMTLGHLDRYRSILAVSAGWPWAWSGNRRRFDGTRLSPMRHTAMILGGTALAIAITYASIVLRK